MSLEVGETRLQFLAAVRCNMALVPALMSITNSSGHLWCVCRCIYAYALLMEGEGPEKNIFTPMLQ